MNDEDIPSPYCSYCGACGEEGCCRPTRCKDGPNCLYPDYQDMLKAAYTQNRQILDILEKNLPSRQTVERIKEILYA